jgi:hypothetical protein
MEGNASNFHTCSLRTLKRGDSLVMCILKFSVHTDHKGKEALIQQTIMHLSTEMGLPIIVHGWAFWYIGF